MGRTAVGPDEETEAQRGRAGAPSSPAGGCQGEGQRASELGSGALARCRGLFWNFPCILQVVWAGYNDSWRPLSLFIAPVSPSIWGTEQGGAWPPRWIALEQQGLYNSSFEKCALQAAGTGVQLGEPCCGCWCSRELGEKSGEGGLAPTHPPCQPDGSGGPLPPARLGGDSPARPPGCART